MARKAEKEAREARIACEKWREGFKHNIDNYHRLMNFVLGKQWDDDEEKSFKTNKKVPLTFNKLATLMNNLLGEQQQNTPQIDVNPLNGCNEEVASIRQNITKNIMLGQDAKTVYQVAAFQAGIGGFGAYSWDTEYRGNHSFDLEPIARHFKDATRVYWDLGAEHVDKTDGMHCGYIQRMTRLKFREVYGKKVEAEVSTNQSISANKQEIALAVQPKTGDDPFSWADDEGITINHFYKRKFSNSMLYKLSNSRTLDQDEMASLVEQSRQMSAQLASQQAMMGEYSGVEQMPEQTMETPAGNDDIEEDFLTLYDEGQPVRIEDKRKIRKSRIMHYVFAGDYLLEESEFPSDDLPIIFVDQNSYYEKDGKQICRSFITDAVDAQRYINYLGTQSAFILKISRYDQYIASKKNVQSADTQRIWEDPYSVQGALIYDESPTGAKPEQLRPPELSVSLSQQYERAVQDLYSSTGLYPTQLGQQGNEVSGAAIDARTRQGSYSTYVFFNSINRAITAGGKILNQMIPRVYDSERVINLMTPDEGRKEITINQQMDEYGTQVQNDIRKGTYEVVLQAGPSYEGQKAQAIESLQAIIQANPELFNLIADLYAENLPLTNTIEIKNRLKTIVPPGVIEAGKTGKMPQESGQNQPSPEEQQAQMQAQAMQADIQYKQAQIQIKQQELALKEKQMQSEIEIEKMKLEIAQLELAGNVEEQRMRYLSETDRTESDNAIAHADNLVKLLTHASGLAHKTELSNNKGR